MKEAAILSTLRRRAASRGLTVVKLRETSRDYFQYGPLMLVDVPTNGVVASGLDISELKAEIG